MKPHPTLKDLYSFPGFRALSRLTEHPDDPGARVVTLRRRQKKVSARPADMYKPAITTAKRIVFVIRKAAASVCILPLNTAAYGAAGAMP